jgi:ABC-type antimicrobial peptide transport system permease subunit
MLKNYLKIALRNFRKQKLYSLINVGGLAIGMACTFLILSWVQNELSYDKFHKNKNEIYRVIFDLKDEQSAGTCGALAPTLKEEIPEIKNYTRAWIGGEWQIHYKEKKLLEKSLYVDPSFLKIFSFPLIEGNPNSFLYESHNVVITKGMAKKLFGDEAPVGKVIYINNRFDKKESFNIAGIVEDVPKNSHIQFDFLFSYNLLKEWYRPTFGEAWSNYSFASYVLVQKGTDIQGLNKKITDCYNNHKQQNPQKLYLQPLTQVYLNADIKNYLGPIGNIEYTRIFSIIALFVLLIACINFMNLSTAMAVRRGKEIGVRKVFGAYKKQIICQYFVEAFLFAFAALPFTFILIELLHQPFQNITSNDIQINFLNPNLIFTSIVIVLLTGILSGSYPSWYLSSFHTSETLKGRLKSERTGIFNRRIFFIIQFSLSIIIISSTIIVSRQMEFIQKKNLGFEKENLLYTFTPGFNNDAIRNELLKNSNIINVGASGFQLDNIVWDQKIRDWSGRLSDEEVSVNIIEVGYHFLETYKMQMADGRYYSEEFATDKTDAIIVNEAAVRAMNMKYPIGKTMNLFGNSQTIIGVVKNFNFESLHSKIEPIALVLYPKQLRCLSIRLKSENIIETINYIKRVLTKSYPDYVFEYHFLDQKIDELYKAENQRAELFSTFSFISIFISCLGLFGLASFTAERKTKEIGIRKVLGATVPSIISMLSKDFIKWILATNLIAWPVAYYFMNKWLQDFAYRIEMSWWMFALAGGIALVIALITVSWQAIKAATANPVESLRYE